MKGLRNLSSMLVMALLLLVPSITKAAEQKVLGFEGKHAPVWYLKATRPYLIGGYGDNFNYDGSRVSPLLGTAEAALDAEKETGEMVVRITGTINPEKGKTYTGDITIYFHPVKGGPPFFEGGVADFIYIHGDTKQGPPVMPKTRTFLAAWGKADIYVNGRLVYKDLDGHMMYTERIRDRITKAIYNHDRSGYYNPRNPSDYSVAAPDERELHFVAHSEKKDPGNFPPNTVWIHLNFENVRDGL